MIKNKLKLIGVTHKVKVLLDKLKLYKRETYNDIIERLINNEKAK